MRRLVLVLCALCALGCWFVQAAMAGTLTREQLVRQFPSPYIVGEKDRELPVWPLFRQNATAIELAGYVFESIDFAPVPGFAGVPPDLLIALDPKGNFIDVQVLSQHEPVRDLAFDADRVELRRLGKAITLNGIAQGYATDLALAAVRRHGVEHALLDIGEFRNSGNRSFDRKWEVGIQDPRRIDAIVGAVAMDGRGMATSGDYATRFTDDYAQHHIWDPATGMSPSELAAVTVFAPDATLADGLSTAFMVMGAARRDTCRDVTGRGRDLHRQTAAPQPDTGRSVDRLKRARLFKICAPVVSH